MYFRVVSALLFWLVAVAESAPSVRCLAKVNRTVSQWSMDCSNLNLRDFPGSVTFYPVFNLTMSRNNIQFPQQLSNWTELRYLDLSYNKIHNLSTNLIQKMQHLVYLNLSHNALEEIGADTFSDFTSLQILDISSNPDLGNKFSDYVPSIRKALANGLKELYLSSMEIEHIPSEMFEDAYNLQVLDLSNNKLEELPVFPQSLLDLDLGSNLVQKISIAPFLQSINLRNLSLNFNSHLEEIDKGAFQNLDSLITLSLKGCTKLENLLYEAFNNEEESKNLSTTENNVKTIPKMPGTIHLKLDEFDSNVELSDSETLMKWFYKESMSAALSGNETRPAFFQVKLSHNIIRYGLILVTFTAFVMVPMAIWFAVRMEKKRREDKPEFKIEKVPLCDSDMPPQHPTCVYVTTTQRA